MRENKIERGIALSGNMRNVTWFTRQYEKGRVKIGDHFESISNTVFEQFKTAVRVINDIYENNWDICFNAYISDERVIIKIVGIYILFPEITINNRDNKTHLIKDLLVLIKFHNSLNEDLKINNLQGSRLNLTYAEYQSDYFHSHLSTSKRSIYSDMCLPYLQDFCTGSGEINMYLSDINGDGFTEERFMRYAMQILSLISYESIEGTPYRYIRNISPTPSSGRVFFMSIEKKISFKSVVIQHYKNIDQVPVIDILINSDNLYTIVDNEIFQKFVYDIPFNGEEKTIFFCSLGERDYYHYGEPQGFTNPPEINSTFIFRSVEKRMVIGQPPTTTVVSHIVHPKLFEYLKKEIEYELNKSEIRKSTIDRYITKPSDANESVQSNPVLVSADS